MNFAFFGYDFSIGIVSRLIQDGHNWHTLFTFPCDGVFNSNSKIIALAKESGIPVYEQKATPENISKTIESGCNLFLAAGYPYKIPPIDETKAYALNLHPALLPKGRGIMPLPYILIEAPETAGITLHRMSPEFDAGDILYQEPLPITHETDIETLSARIAMRSPEIVSKIVKSFPHYWNGAKPQDESQATSYPAPSESMRTLDWTQDIKSLTARGRAFGRYGVIAKFPDRKLAVYNFTGWQEPHILKPGTIAVSLPREIIIAARDGFICLKEFYELPNL